MTILGAVFAWVVLSNHSQGVRVVEASSCDVIDVQLSLGMSVLLQFDSDPTLTFHADEEHFLVRSSESAKRTIAIIPNIKAEEIKRLFRLEDQGSGLPGPSVTANTLDRSFRTNLFVFFKNSMRFIFRLRFSEKERADYVVRIRQKFKKGCDV